MIARRIPPRESRAGGFQRLGQYITVVIVTAPAQAAAAGASASAVGGAGGVVAAGGVTGGMTALGEYLADQAGHNDRVEWVRITNCHLADSLKASIREIDATQAMNTRMKADPNYHLLVSFPPGEIPARAQIEDIEDTLVNGLGLAAHQRISALHADKAHLHLHVAISLIHPETYRAVSVWKDYEKLQEMAVRLEIKHGLERTDHTMPAERGRGRGAPMPTPMQAHTAQEPFTDWVRRVAGEDIKEAGAGQGGWQALHETAAAYGLEIRQRGAGLVVGKIGEPALNMKASALDRGLGYQQLVARFGAFEPAGERARAMDPRMSYTRMVPPGQRANDGLNNGLWDRYEAERENAFQARAALEAKGQEYLQKLNAYYKDQYAELKRWRTELFDPRIRFDALKRERAKDMEKFRAHMKASRSGSPLPSWPDWLRARAERGDAQAAAALRGMAAKVAKQERATATLIRTPADSARVVRNLDPDLALKPKVTRGGDIVYRMPDGGTVVDKAEGLHMPVPSTAAALLILDMARDRSGGQPLSVNGTKAQAEAIIEAAVQLRAAVTFADPVMESARQSRIAEAIQAEKEEEEKENEDEVEKQAADGRQEITQAPVTLDQARAMSIEELEVTIAGDETVRAARDKVADTGRQLQEDRQAFDAIIDSGRILTWTGSALLQLRDEAWRLHQQAESGAKELDALQEALKAAEARPEMEMLRAVLAEKQQAEQAAQAEQAQIARAALLREQEKDQGEEWEL